MPLPFNKSLDTKLIRCVQQNPILYDNHEHNYMDFNAREVAWQKIGDEIKRPAKVCKSRWINIRDMMRRKIRERMRHPEQRSYNYKYEAEMAFMMPFYKESLAESFINQDEYGEYLDEDEDKLASCDIVEAPSVFSHSGSDVDAEPKDIKPTIAKAKKKKRKEEFDISACQIVNESSQELNPTDPLDVFLMTIGTTLRSFSPYYLNQAKSKIFTVVQEYELQQIVDKNGHPPGAGS